MPYASDQLSVISSIIVPVPHHYHTSARGIQQHLWKKRWWWVNGMILFWPRPSSSTKRKAAASDFAPSYAAFALHAFYSADSGAGLTLIDAGHLWMQYRIREEDILTSPEDEWREKVKLLRWVRSKIQFEFPTDVAAVGSDFQEEKKVFWDPSGSPAR